VSEYLRPASLDEAVAARVAHPDWTVLAGGTDLLVAANQRPEPPGFIDLFGLAEIRGIEAGGDGAIAIGAATTYKELLESPLIAEELPMLRASAREIGALQIQARGTVGGNLGTSSPVGDTLPVWLALDAEIELVGPGGSRRVAYDQYCTGYRRTALAADELIARVHLPPRPAGLRQYWRKMGTRRAQSISKVMVAATAVVSDQVIERIRIGLGAVADRPIRARDAEAAAVGNTPADAEPLVRAAIRRQVIPIDDLRSTAAYRLTAAENVVARFLLSLTHLR
jgi:xanthine dehydrogenase small subunit